MNLSQCTLDRFDRKAHMHDHLQDISVSNHVLVYHVCYNLVCLQQAVLAARGDPVLQDNYFSLMASHPVVAVSCRLSCSHLSLVLRNYTQRFAISQFQL